MKFLFLFAQSNESFRLPEFQALADLYGINLDLHASDFHDESNPFLILDLPDEQTARKLVKRSVLCKAVYEFYADASSLDELHCAVKKIQHDAAADSRADPWTAYRHSSFKFDFVFYRGSRSLKNQIKIIESFDYLGLEGQIRMKNPEQIFTILEDYEPQKFVTTEPPVLSHIYFARFICESGRTKLIDTYDLKKRNYIGTTSFEAELALISCNIAQASPGKIMYDPFVGTGSFLVCAAEFGALTLGSDIDPRTMKGGQADSRSIGKKNKDIIKTLNLNPKDRTIVSNFRQYGTLNKFLDTMCMDFTHNSLRDSFKLDIILSDPPYGVREGLKVLGSKDSQETQKEEEKETKQVQHDLQTDPIYGEGYIPPKKPYAFSSLLDDLLDFAYQRLTDTGRLCFWMPTANEDLNKPNTIPQHPGLHLIACCTQEFGKWSRQLLVYTKKDLGGCEPIDTVTTKLSALNHGGDEFRDKYFRGFKEKEGGKRTKEERRKEKQGLKAA